MGWIFWSEDNKYLRDNSNSSLEVDTLKEHVITSTESVSHVSPLGTYTMWKKRSTNVPWSITKMRSTAVGQQRLIHRGNSPSATVYHLHVYHKKGDPWHARISGIATSDTIILRLQLVDKIAEATGASSVSLDLLVEPSVDHATGWYNAAISLINTDSSLDAFFDIASTETIVPIGYDWKFITAVGTFVSTSTFSSPLPNGAHDFSGGQVCTFEVPKVSLLIFPILCFGGGLHTSTIPALDIIDGFNTGVPDFFSTCPSSIIRADGTKQILHEATDPSYRYTINRAAGGQGRLYGFFYLAPV